MLRLAQWLFFALSASVFTSEPASPKPSEPCIRVECHGHLRHGVVAIGGETTGTTITFDRMTWELKLPDEASRAFATEHHKKPIVAVGSLRRVAGTQIPERWIVDVERISEQNHATPKDGVTITLHGQLRPGDTGESRGTVIEANGVTWTLDLSKDASIQDKAKSLARKLVVVNGQIERAVGAEIPLRTIIRVEALDVPLGRAVQD